MDNSSTPNSEPGSGAAAAAREGLRTLAAALVSSERLNELEALRTLQSALADLLPVAALEARRQGLTWDQIGQLLGVTEQAAHQRFKHLEQGDDVEGVSAAAAARQKGVNRSTIQRNPERYGYERIPSEGPGRPRYRRVE